MGKRSRTKGAAFERRLAKRWRDSGLFPDAQRRGEGQAKRDDADKPPDVGGVPFRVEAKDRKSINVRASLEQAEALSGDAPAIAVCHWYGDSMEDSIVCMRLTEWERLVEKATHPLYVLHVHPPFDDDIKGKLRNELVGLLESSE